MCWQKVLGQEGSEDIYLGTQVECGLLFERSGNLAKKEGRKLQRGQEGKRNRDPKGEVERRS